MLNNFLVMLNYIKYKTLLGIHVSHSRHSVYSAKITIVKWTLFDEIVHWENWVTNRWERWHNGDFLWFLSENCNSFRSYPLPTPLRGQRMVMVELRVQTRWGNTKFDRRGNWSVSNTLLMESAEIHNKRTMLYCSRVE